MYYPLKRNGNMPVGRVPPLFIPGETASVLEMRIIRIVEMLNLKMLGVTCESMGILICTGMFSSEWDFYQVDLGTATVIDPLGAQSGSPVIKGEAGFTGDRLRSAYRSANAADLRSDNVGFRLGFKQINQAPANLNSAAPLAFREPTGWYFGWHFYCHRSGYQSNHKLSLGEWNRGCG